MSYGNWGPAWADPMVRVALATLLGLTVVRIIVRRHPAWRLIVHGAFFAALTGLLIYSHIVPFEASPRGLAAPPRLLLGLAKMIWWISAALSLVSFVRVFIILERKPREGRLIQDLAVGTIYVGTVLCVIAYVFDAPIGTLIATSGILAVIIGLAMQSTLSDVFSGIALNIGRPYGIGDWIILRDGIEGRVVETNWRATHLLDGANDLVVVPNSDLAKARLTNVTTPERSRGTKVVIHLLPTTQPSVMIETMRVALLSSNTIMASPEPTVQVKSMDALGIELELSFRVADMALTVKAQNEVFDLVYRHTKAAGLELAQPSDAARLAYASPGPAAQPAQTTPMRLLSALPLFATLTAEERETLSAAMVRLSYRKGETIVPQGETLSMLIIIRSGVAIVSRQENAHEVELGRLAPGDWFGESGLLTGAGEFGTIRALTFVVVYQVRKEALSALMQERPLLVDELGTILARRAELEKHVITGGAAAGSLESVPSLVTRIRHLFDVPQHGT